MAECLVESPKLTLGILGGHCRPVGIIEPYSSRKRSQSGREGPLEIPQEKQPPLAV